MTYTFKSTAVDETYDIRKATILNVPDDTDMENIRYLYEKMRNHIRNLYKRKAVYTCIFGLLLILGYHYITEIVKDQHLEQFNTTAVNIIQNIVCIAIGITTGIITWNHIQIYLCPKTVSKRIERKVMEKVIQQSSYHGYEKFQKIYGHRYMPDNGWNFHILEDLDTLLYYGNAFKTMQDISHGGHMIKIQIKQFNYGGFQIDYDYIENKDEVHENEIIFGACCKKLIHKLHMDKDEFMFDLAAYIFYEPYS